LFLPRPSCQLPSRRKRAPPVRIYSSSLLLDRSRELSASGASSICWMPLIRGALALKV